MAVEVSRRHLGGKPRNWQPRVKIRSFSRTVSSSPGLFEEFRARLAVMKELGLPASHVERARFSEFRPLERLVLAIMMDFLPGVAPYEGTLTVDFFPSGEWVRMVVTLSPMHDDEFTKMASEGLASQFRNLDKLFPGRNQ